MNFTFDALIYYFPKLIASLPITLKLVAMGAILGIIVGLVFAFIRVERIPILNQIVIVLISFFRGTPIIIQMFVVYYLVPGLLSLIGIDALGWEKITFLYITFGLNTGAFLAEAFRSAILAVPKLQGDAALSIGLSRVQTYFRVIIPQAIIIAIPIMGTTIIALLQESALAFTFGVLDVIGKINLLSKTYGHQIEAYIDAAIIFIILAIILENIFGYLEKRVSKQSFPEAQGA
ncbi:MAG: ABC transporter permease subunit [Coriobacteriales bacterium]|jgi:L-cystine transport system permease protein|nr:ABC transporter permease subunit [Coriobacteriales bacterium]